MRERLLHSLIQGDRATWAAMGVLWALTAVLVLIHRSGGKSAAAYTWALLSMTTATSLAGIPLAAALAVPRVRWRVADAPDLVAASSGADTWRKLRGPVVAIPGPEPELAVPTIDAQDRWVLVGLLSGAPIAGLPAAEATTAEPGGPRLCRIEGSGCRAWPVGWPDPGRSTALGELVWARPAAGVAERALGYDVETGLYLVRIDPATGREGEPLLELVGRATADPPRDGASVLFVVRTVVGGRLRAARIAATPAIGDAARAGTHAFHLQRVDVSLTAAPRAFAWVARPLLVATGFALPVGILIYVLAPLLLRLRRRGAPVRELRREAAARVGPWLETAAAFAAGVAAAAPAVVAIASLWGSR